MKIVLVNQANKTYKMSPNGYLDTVDPYLKFGIIVEEGMDISTIYNDFTVNDISSIKFTYDNDNLAWVKNHYNNLTSFEVKTNQPLSHDPESDTDVIATVAYIELSKDDAAVRLNAAESTIATQNKLIEQLQKQIESMTAQINTLSSDVTTVKGDVENIKTEMSSDAPTTGDVEENVPEQQPVVDEENQGAPEVTA